MWISDIVIIGERNLSECSGVGVRWRDTINLWKKSGEALKYKGGAYVLRKVEGHQISFKRVA